MHGTGNLERITRWENGRLHDPETDRRERERANRRHAKRGKAAERAAARAMLAAEMDADR